MISRIAIVISRTANSLAVLALLPAAFGNWSPAALLVVPALLLWLFRAVKWAFWPRHELPRHRVRHLELRLFFRLHPGRGHATIAELARHWSARSSAEKDRWARP